MTPPTSYRYAGGYNWCFGGVMTPPYRVRSTLIQLYDKLEFERALKIEERLSFGTTSLLYHDLSLDRNTVTGIGDFGEGGTLKALLVGGVEGQV